MAVHGYCWSKSQLHITGFGIRRHLWWLVLSTSQALEEGVSSLPSCESHGQNNSGCQASWQTLNPEPSADTIHKIKRKNELRAKSYTDFHTSTMACGCSYTYIISTCEKQKFLCVHVFMCVSACLYRGYITTLGLLQSFSTLYLRQDPSLNPGLANLGRLAGQWVPGICLFWLGQVLELKM